MDVLSIQNLIFLAVGSVVGYFIKKEKRILKLESQVNEMSKDIDGIALFIGTPRALSKLKQKQLE